MRGAHGLWLAAMPDLAQARDLLATLVGFDTTSRGSNLALIEWVEAYLDRAPPRAVRAAIDLAWEMQRR